MGDRKAHINSAISEIKDWDNCELRAISSMYETAPVDVPEAFADMPFINAAIEIELIHFDPTDLLHRLQAIETRAGRVRTIKNGPRPLDLDLIWIEGCTMQTPEITLPHPRAAERDFVLIPLADLHGKTINEIKSFLSH